jgi:hypothetical protein
MGCEAEPRSGQHGACLSNRELMLMMKMPLCRFFHGSAHGTVMCVAQRRH